MCTQVQDAGRTGEGERRAQGDRVMRTAVLDDERRDAFGRPARRRRGRDDLLRPACRRHRRTVDLAEVQRAHRLLDLRRSPTTTQVSAFGSIALARLRRPAPAVSAFDLGLAALDDVVVRTAVAHVARRCVRHHRAGGFVRAGQAADLGGLDLARLSSAVGRRLAAGVLGDLACAARRSTRRSCRSAPARTPSTGAGPARSAAKLYAP